MDNNVNIPKTDESSGISKSVKIGIFATILFLVVGLVIFILLNESEIASSRDGDDDNSFASFIPIWVAIFPTFLAARKKEEGEINKKEKNLLLALAVITGLIVLGTILLWVLG